MALEFIKIRLAGPDSLPLTARLLLCMPLSLTAFPFRPSNLCRIEQHADRPAGSRGLRGSATMALEVSVKKLIDESLIAIHQEKREHLILLLGWKPRYPGMHIIMPDHGLKGRTGLCGYGQ
ncbi:hypothetical protein D3C86_1568600 [compost metagenome]